MHTVPRFAAATQPCETGSDHITLKNETCAAHGCEPCSLLITVLFPQKSIKGLNSIVAFRQSVQDPLATDDVFFRTTTSLSRQYQPFMSLHLLLISFCVSRLSCLGKA